MKPIKHTIPILTNKLDHTPFSLVILSSSLTQLKTINLVLESLPPYGGALLSHPTPRQGGICALPCRGRHLG